MSFKAAINRARNVNWREISLEQPASWPQSFRIFLLSLLIALVSVAGWWWLLADDLARLAKAQTQQQQLMQRYQAEAVRLDNEAQLQIELSSLSHQTESLLQNLPLQLDVPEWIDQISQAATQAGLVLERITPEAELSAAGFSQIPLFMAVHGQYHQLGAFVAALSALPGLITVHELSIHRLAQQTDQSDAAAGLLFMTLQARIYRQPSAGEE